MKLYVPTTQDNLGDVSESWCESLSSGKWVGEPEGGNRRGGVSIIYGRDMVFLVFQVEKINEIKNKSAWLPIV